MWQARPQLSLHPYGSATIVLLHLFSKVNSVLTSVSGGAMMWLVFPLTNPSKVFLPKWKKNPYNIVIIQAIDGLLALLGYKT